MDEIINHFITMKKQAENQLSPNRKEMGDWHRGYYSGERMAYGHCIEYLQRHLTSRQEPADTCACKDSRWGTGHL